MTDEELLERYKKTGDSSFLAKLYEPYMPLVYGSCLKYFKNVTDAEDAVMDIYEKITKKARTHNIEFFKSWLFVVTRNHCFEKLRRKTTTAEKENAASVMYSDDVFHPDSVDKDMEVTILHECLEKLEDHQKAAVQLFYFKKMSYSDIADTQSLTFNQVRSRIQNGRRNLKRCIESQAHRMEQ